MTATHKTHILLVSAQAAPNLLPALDPALKPAEAILLVSEKMKPRAESLEKVLKESGVKTSRVALANEHDFDALEATLLDLATHRDGQAIALNVTGGTKLMALAAQSIAQEAGWSVFYVDVDTDEVIWLGKNAAPRHKLTEQLRLPHYLKGYGFDLTQGIARPQPSQRHNDLLETLLIQIGSLEQPLSQLNWLVQQAEDRKKLEVAMTEQQADSRSFEALLRKFEDARILTLQGNIIRFPSEAERSFAKGGWLEHHVFRTVSKLTAELGIRDKAANLKVTDINGVHNELDVPFIARNRLFVIECKTARMDKPESPKANDTLFKLSEICKRVGGLGTRGMLASYRAMNEPEKKLAKALGIELVCGAELVRLEEKLKTWTRA